MVKSLLRSQFQSKLVVADKFYQHNTNKKLLHSQMKLAASELSFELAARLRDEIRELKRELKGMNEAGN